MRNKWAVLAIFAWQTIGAWQGIAAEKNRDWQTGQILDADQTAEARGDTQVHTIASKDKNYVVRGSLGSGDQTLTVGASVRFAVEGKNMFISSAGKELRLYILGERVAAPRGPEVPHPAVAADKPAAEATDSLDNDAVVKMIVGGLKEDTVVHVIEARPGKYTLSPDAVLALRAAGVPQSVIAAMTARMKVQR
jgi:hypothetical protein